MLPPMLALRAFALALAATAAVSPLDAAAEPGPASEERLAARRVLERLDSRLATMRSMKGRFIQTFTSAGLGVPQAESGRFALLKPDRLRWDYTSPEKKTAVSDGDHTWLHVPEEGVVYRGTVKVWKRSSAFAILSGGRISDTFEAVSVDAVTAARKGDLVLRLRPREADEFTEVIIEIEPEGMVIRSVAGVDGMGNRITASFTDIEENPTFPADFFVFKPPPSAKVVDHEGGPAPR
jgi:outer membrane lipoprotein carrier protein